MHKNPLVSVAMITYNQEDYIQQAIDSVLEQQVDFDYEIIIGDDNSTDSTPKILKKYAEKHKNIKLINRKKNIGAIPNFMQTFRQASGKYVALCEGDDFWTDPTKLQKQVDFLEKNNDYALVFHPVRVFFENGNIEDSIYPGVKNGFDLNNLLKSNFIQTNSVMYRARSTDEYNNLPEDIIPGDWYLHLFHARFGKIGFIDKVMSAYRRHERGIWWGDKDGNHGEDFWKKNAERHIVMFVKLLDIFGDDEDYNDIIIKNFFIIINNIKTIEYSDRIGVIKNIFITRPIYIESILSSAAETYIRIEHLIKNKETQLDVYNDKINSLYKENEILLNKVLLIKQSWVWRVRNKIAKYLGKEII